MYCLFIETMGIGFLRIEVALEEPVTTTSLTSVMEAVKLKSEVVFSVNEIFFSTFFFCSKFFYIF